MAIHNEIGKIGEDVASKFLERKGHKIVQRNYWKPYGEIDIVSCENNKTHFVEVKTVSYETNDDKDGNISTSEVDIKSRKGSDNGRVSHGTYRPEDNLHPRKLQRLSRVIQSYLLSHETVGEWQFDVIAVYLDIKNKKAKVKWLQNIVIGS